MSLHRLSERGILSTQAVLRRDPRLGVRDRLLVGVVVCGLVLLAGIQAPPAAPGLAPVGTSPSVPVAGLWRGGVVRLGSSRDVSSRPTVVRGLSRPALSRGGIALVPIRLRGSLSVALGADQRLFWGRRSVAGSVAFGSRARGLLAVLSPGGALSVSGTSGVRIRLGRLAVGRDGDPVRSLGGDRVRLTRNRAEVSGDGVRESVASGPLGVEQSFTIASRPAGHGPLVISQPMSGASARLLRGGSGVRFGSGLGAVTDTGLSVAAADGRRLPARMVVRGGRLLITVNDAGAVYPVRIDPTYSETSELSDGANNDGFGISVAVSGSTIVVGAPLSTVGNPNDGEFQGAIYVFTMSGASIAQIAEETDPAQSNEDRFGTSVAMAGSTIVVGATELDGDGAAYVYTVSGSDVTLMDSLSANDGARQDEFGTSVAVSGSTIVVGAPDHNAGFTNPSVAQGTAYVYTVSGSSVTQLAELPNPVTSDSQADDFAESVAVSGATIVLGAPPGYEAPDGGIGTAFVYTVSGTSVTQTAELDAPDDAHGDGFGISVSMSGSTIVVGAPYVTVNGQNNEGVADVYTKSGSSVSQTQELYASDGYSGDEFGSTVDVSGSTVLVGAPEHVNDSEDVGATYVFMLSGASPQTGTLVQELTAPDPYNEDEGQPGEAVAMLGSTILVGNSGASESASYVFQGDVDVFQQLPSAAVSVTAAGSGTGSVGSSPYGIACGGGQTTCSAQFATGTSVTLTATAAAGSTFTGFSGGGCSPTGADSCAISSLEADAAVTATFAPTSTSTGTTPTTTPTPTPTTTTTTAATITSTPITTPTKSGLTPAPQPRFSPILVAPSGAATLDLTAPNLGVRQQLVETFTIDFSVAETEAAVARSRTHPVRRHLIGSVHGSLKLRSGQHKKVKLKLSKKLVKYLETHHDVKVELRITSVEKGHRTETTTHSLSLRFARIS
jgi:hypothetical protein